MARILLGYGATSDKRKSLNRHYIFNGGAQGNWRVERMVPVRGEPLAKANYLDVADAAPHLSWNQKLSISPPTIRKRTLGGSQPRSLTFPMPLGKASPPVVGNSADPALSLSLA